MYKYILLFFLIFLVLPLLFLFNNAFYNDAYTLEYVKFILVDNNFYQVLFNSLFIALITALLAIIVANIIAYFIKFSPFANNKVIVLINNLIYATTLVPTISFGFIFLYLLGVNGLITNLLNYQLIDIYTMQGLIFVSFFYVIGPVFLIVNNGYKQIGVNEINVSYVFGDNKFQKFRNTVFPKIKTSLYVAFFLAFNLVITDYGIPLSLGFDTLATYLFDQMLGSNPNINTGAVVAIILAIPSVISYKVISKFNKDDSNKVCDNDLVKKNNIFRDVILSLVIIVLFILVILFVMMIFILPFLANYPDSFELSFDNFTRIFKKYDMLKTINVTIVIAFSTALIGTMITFITALIGTKNNKVGIVIDKLAVTPNMIPGISLGLAYVLIFNKTFIYETLFIIVIVNIIHFFTTPYLLFKNNIIALGDEYQAVSNVYGDSKFNYYRRILIPILRIEFIDAFIYFFVSSITTISAIVFLVTIDTTTLALRIKELELFADFSGIFVITFFIFMINLLANFIKSIFHHYWK